MIISAEDVRELPGKDLVHRGDDEKIGQVAEVFLDPDTGAPEWAMTRTGPLGTHSRLLPLGQAEWVGDKVLVPFDKDTVHSAPDVGTASVRPTGDERARLLEHYGLAT